jgi:hypothetical protein
VHSDGLLVLGMPGFLIFLRAVGTARHDLGWWRHYCACSGGVRRAFLWPSHQLRCRSIAHALPSAAGAVKWIVAAVLSGGRWTLNRRGVDPSDRICLRTRMETVEGYFGRAPRMSLRLQPVGFQPNSQIRARGYLHAGDENNRRRLRFRKYVSRERSAWISSKDIWAFLLLAVIALRTGKAEG